MYCRWVPDIHEQIFKVGCIWSDFRNENFKYFREFSPGSHYFRGTRYRSAKLVVVHQVISPTILIFRLFISPHVLILYNIDGSSLLMTFIAIFYWNKDVASKSRLRMALTSRRWNSNLPLQCAPEIYSLSFQIHLFGKIVLLYSILSSLNPWKYSSSVAIPIIIKKNNMYLES